MMMDNENEQESTWNIMAGQESAGPEAGNAGILPGQRLIDDEDKRLRAWGLGLLEVYECILAHTGQNGKDGAGSQERCSNAKSNPVNAERPGTYKDVVLEGATNIPSQNKAPDQEQVLHENMRMLFQELERSFNQTQKEMLILSVEQNTNLYHMLPDERCKMKTDWQDVAATLNQCPSSGIIWTPENSKETWKVMVIQALFGTEFEKVSGQMIIDDEDRRRIIKVIHAHDTGAKSVYKRKNAPTPQEDKDQTVSQHLNATLKQVISETPRSYQDILKGATNILSQNKAPDREQELPVDLRRPLKEPEHAKSEQVNAEPVTNVHHRTEKQNDRKNYMRS